MKTFPAAFATELAKKSITPVWVLRMTVNSVVYHISDIAYTFPVGALSGFAGTTLPWVSSWGQLHENISGSLGEILIADLSLSLLVDQANADNIRHLALTHDLETSPAELYLWLDGLNAASVAPQMVFRGYVKDVSLPDLTRVDITIEDEAARYHNYIGTRLDTNGYPLADPDDIGKLIPIPFGTVSKVRALCVDSGWVSSIIDSITSGQTSFKVSELPASSLVGKTVTVDDEQMTVTSSSTTPPVENKAAAAIGSTVTATSTLAGLTPLTLIDGNRITSTTNVSNWVSSASPSYPQVLTVTFPALMEIDRMDIFFPQDSLTSPVTPVLGSALPAIGTQGTLYIQPDFTLWVRDEGDTYWIQVGTAVGNTAVWRQWTFLTKRTRKVKVEFTSGRQSDAYVNCVELEAWGTLADAGSGNWLGVTRGVNSTLAVEHTKTSTIIEKKTTPLVYLCSDRPLTSIGSIFARIRGILVDITSDCTKYTNVGAGDFAGKYVGKAAITIPDFAKVSQRISIELAGDVTAADPGHSHNTGPTGDTPVTHTGTGGSNTLVEQMFTWSVTNNLFRIPPQQSFVARTVNFTPVSGTIKTCATTVSVSGYLPSTGGFWYLTCNGVRITPVMTSFSTAPVITHDATSMQGNSVSLVVGAYPTAERNTELRAYCGGTITAASRSITYNSGVAVTVVPGPSLVAVANTLELTGNSVADIMIGDAVLVNMVRTMATPAAAFNDILTNYCGDSTPLTQVGTFPAGWAFNGCITEYRTAQEWFDTLAFQCLSYFRKSAGVVRLIYRDPSAAAAGTISACKLNDEGMKAISHRKAPISDVVNHIKVLYNRQWDNSGKQADAYASATAVGEWSGSVAVHGVRERPELFMFDFVTSSSMAVDLQYGYLFLLMNRGWLITFTAFLDSLKYEFGDFITLGIDSGQKARIIESGIAPGDTGRIDTIEFTVIV